MGTTIAELGNMNRPLDMIAYKKDGADYILMANSNRGVMKLDANNLGKFGAITDKIAATEGVPYETIGELQGVRRLDRLDFFRHRWAVRADRDRLLCRRSVLCPVGTLA